MKDDEDPLDPEKMADWQVKTHIDLSKEGDAWKPGMLTPISEEDANKLEALIDELEENEEVQEIFTNAE